MFPLVETMGLEPTTPCLQMWAGAPRPLLGECRQGGADAVLSVSVREGADSCATSGTWRARHLGHRSAARRRGASTPPMLEGIGFGIAPGHPADREQRCEQPPAVGPE